MRRAGIIGLVAALTLVASPAASAAGAVAGPIDLTGTLDGAAFEIRVPAGWNGTLVMYAHGYRDVADHPGEADEQLTAVQALDTWVRTGRPPSAFPPDQGFINVNPPPWPQP